MTAQYDTSWVGGLRYARTAVKSGSTWLVTATTPLNRQSFVRLDTVGRPIMARVTGLDSVSFGYDAQGRVDTIQNGGRIERYSYDAQGGSRRRPIPSGGV